ncbi:tektin-4 isoform X2 [Hippocampus comes]|uniref:tektin-4 isoform X1 n=1 Tax=Hippocampus comes TaxID=109280 RepID=UPI00094E7540|nr:PREDICTED: tektin-4-like isoform X1 [Hippocampus comes]XP_019744607.1 PREDICTED: tektin-4-like isoform X2 [Hippocampus comes]
MTEPLVMASSRAKQIMCSRCKKMSAEVLVSKPHYDGGAVAQGLRQEQGAPLEPPSVLATAGFRSAKYTPAEWFSGYRSLLQQAGADHFTAQTIQEESRVLRKDTEATTVQTQTDGTRLLGERLQDIHRWKSELQEHIGRLLSDTTALQALKMRLERALDATETPFAIAVDNLTCRSRRLGPDLVRDCVEEELLKEVDLIRNVQALLKRTIDQVATQIKLNRDTKQALEFDWSDKYEAYALDLQCGRFTDKSTDTQHYPITAAMLEQMSDVPSWIKFTQDNLHRAFREEKASKDLRLEHCFNQTVWTTTKQHHWGANFCVYVLHISELVQQVLLDTTKDLRVQCSNVDQAFLQRCAEQMDAKIQLEMQFKETLEQIGAQERNIVALQKAIDDKDAPQRVAESRLYRRYHRPNMELCRDEPQISLEGEVREIDATLASLQQQLRDARSSLSHLEDTRMALEKDIMCKSNSLFIEREKCMTQRKLYPTISTLSGY